MDYAPLFANLFSIGQMLCEQTYGVADRLCQEVAMLTQERTQLLLHHRRSSEETPVHLSSVAVSYPVQFRNRVYGTLYVASDSGQPASPALPPTIAYLLAQACGWLLYTFELSALLQYRGPEPNYQVSVSLTTREREVLMLICRGYDQQTIAKTLSIALTTVHKHRQHIYEQLGVHNERDVLLLAYQMGLFSPIEELLS